MSKREKNQTLENLHVTSTLKPPPLLEPNTLPATQLYRPTSRLEALRIVREGVTILPPLKREREIYT